MLTWIAALRGAVWAQSLSSDGFRALLSAVAVDETREHQSQHGHCCQVCDGVEAGLQQTLNALEGDVSVHMTLCGRTQNGMWGSGWLVAGVSARHSSYGQASAAQKHLGLT